MNNHIYKIEINCYETCGKYKWTLWQKEKDEDDSEWATCAFDCTNSELEAYETAYHHLKKYFQKN